MSFLSDLAHGNFGSLGSDIRDAPSSLASHPSQLYETLGGVAALATGGLALGGLAGLGGGELALGGLGEIGTGAAGEGGGILTGGAALGLDQGALTAVPGSVAGASPFDIGAAGIDQYLNPAAAGITGSGIEGGIPSGFLAGSGITDVGALPGTTGLEGSLAGGVQPVTAGGVTGVSSSGTTLGGTTAAATGTGAPTSAWSQFANDPLGTLGNGAVKSVTSNPLGIGAGLAGLGYSIYAGQKTDKNVAALETQATLQAQQGQQLESYLQTGTLPPGLAAQMSQAVAANKARIISNYAAQGQSTDPTKNSALAQDLNSVDMQAQAMQGQIATQLLSSGQNAVNMSDQLYQSLAQIDMTQAQNMGKAIANFASSLAGKTNVSVGGAGVTLQQAA